MRVTVKVKVSGDSVERDFHLDADKAERFAAKVQREGGTAQIVSLQIGADLRALLTRVGVNLDNVR